MLKFPQPPSEGGLSIILPYTQGRDTENPRNSSEAAQRAGREACTRILAPERGHGQNAAQAPTSAQNCLRFWMVD